MVRKGDKRLSGALIRCNPSQPTGRTRHPEDRQVGEAIRDPEEKPTCADGRTLLQAAAAA